MTQITIFIPELIEITEGQTIERNQIPLIPATQILGQLLPDQIPLGVIPGLENFEQLDEGIQALSDRVSAIEANDYLTGPELDEQLDDFQQQFDSFTASISSKASQTALDAIASTVAAMEAEVGAIELELAQKAPTNHAHAISQITGLSATLQTLTDQIAALQTQDSDLTAIAALNTQPFGRSLLTLVDAAAARTALGVAEGGGQGNLQSLTYTLTQSSTFGAFAGTFANLTDGNRSTGAATNSSTNEWIEADLGSIRQIEQITLSGGNFAGWGSVSAYLNGRQLQASLDDVIWTPLLTISGITDAASAQVAIPTIRARYLRIFTGSFVSVAEWQIWGR